MNINLSLKDLPNTFGPFIRRVRTYISFIFLLTVLILFGFFVLRINTLVNQGPNEDFIAEKMATSKPAKIDTDAVERIENLEATNVEVRALFKQARDNPFNE